MRLSFFLLILAEPSFIHPVIFSTTALVAEDAAFMVNTAPIDEKGATSTTNSIGMAPNATDKRVQGVARTVRTAYSM